MSHPYLKVRGYRHGPLFRAEKTTREAQPPRPAAVCLRPGTLGQIPRESQGHGHNSLAAPRPRHRAGQRWGVCPWRPSGAASDMPTPRQCSATPTNGTPPPTRRSAPGGSGGSPGARIVDLPRFWSVSYLGRPLKCFALRPSIAALRPSIAGRGPDPGQSVAADPGRRSAPASPACGRRARRAQQGHQRRQPR